MQTKSSYRALKWTLFMGIAATLASACVVSTGDGDDDDVSIEGGDGGTNNTSGTANTGGTKAGNSTGGTSAGTSTAGTGGSGNAGAMGGEGGGTGYEPGLCEEDMPLPTELPSCEPKAGDGMVATDCLACLKARCCSEWKTCYGSNPTSACGWGPTEQAEGQFDCKRTCYTREKKADPNKDDDDILAGCDGECLLQCSNEDFVNQDVVVLEGCAWAGPDEDPFTADDCALQCFPAE
jgi:hypothetical protein